MTKERQPSASRSSLVIGSSFLVVLVLNYGFAMLMAWILPAQELGIVGLAQSFIMISATLLGSGFPGVVSRTIARKNSLVEAFPTIKSGVAGNLAIAALYSVVLLAVGTRLGFGKNGNSILALLLLETFLIAIVALWAGILQGLMYFGALGLSRLVEGVVKLGVGMAFVLLGFGAMGAVSAIILGTAASLCILLWRVRHFPFWRERTWGGRESYQGALGLFVALAAQSVIVNFDIIGLKLFGPLQEADTLAGYYQAASMIPRVLILLASTWASTLFPYIARANDNELADYVRGQFKYLLLLIIPIHIVLIAIPETVIVLIFPHSYIVGAPAMRLAAVGSALLSISTLMTNTFQARSMPRVPALSLPVVALGEVVMLKYLVPRYSIQGAAFALMGAGALACAIQLPFFIRRFPWGPQWPDVLRYILASGALYGLLLLLPDGSDVWAAITIVFSFVAYIVLLAFLRLLRPADLTTLTGGVRPERLSSLGKIYTALSRLIETLNRIMPR